MALMQKHWWIPNDFGKIIKVKVIHILSYDQMVSRKSNNPDNKMCELDIYWLSLPILPRITLKTTQQLNVGLPRITWL